MTSYGKRSFTIKEKASSNFAASLVNDKRIATYVLHHPMNSLRNKPLMALN